MLVLISILLIHCLVQADVRPLKMREQSERYTNWLKKYKFPANAPPVPNPNSQCARIDQCQRERKEVENYWYRAVLDDLSRHASSLPLPGELPNFEDWHCWWRRFADVLRPEYPQPPQDRSDGNLWTKYWLGMLRHGQYWISNPPPSNYRDKKGYNEWQDWFGPHQKPGTSLKKKIHKAVNKIKVELGIRGKHDLPPAKTHSDSHQDGRDLAQPRDSRQNDRNEQMRHDNYDDYRKDTSYDRDRRPSRVTSNDYDHLQYDGGSRGSHDYDTDRNYRPSESYQPSQSRDSSSPPDTHYTHEGRHQDYNDRYNQSHNSFQDNAYHSRSNLGYSQRNPRASPELNIRGIDFSRQAQGNFGYGREDRNQAYSQPSIFGYSRQEHGSFGYGQDRNQAYPRSSGFGFSGASPSYPQRYVDYSSTYGRGFNQDSHWNSSFSRTYPSYRPSGLNQPSYGMQQGGLNSPSYSYGSQHSSYQSPGWAGGYTGSFSRSPKLNNPYQFYGNHSTLGPVYSAQKGVKLHYYIEREGRLSEVSADRFHELRCGDDSAMTCCAPNCQNTSKPQTPNTQPPYSSNNPASPSKHPPNTGKQSASSDKSEGFWNALTGFWEKPADYHQRQQHNPQPTNPAYGRSPTAATIIVQPATDTRPNATGTNIAPKPTPQWPSSIVVSQSPGSSTVPQWPSSNIVSQSPSLSTVPQWPSSSNSASPSTTGISRSVSYRFSTSPTQQNTGLSTQPVIGGTAPPSSFSYNQSLNK